MSSCIYHEDKLKFDCVRKSLQKGKIIPRKYASKLAMAVCSCRRRKEGSQEFAGTGDDLNVEIRWLSNRLNTFEGNTNLSVIKTFIDDLSQKTITNASYEKFVYIVSQALMSNFDLLECEIPIKEDKARSKQKVTPITIQYILQKKMKKYPVKATVKIPMFGGLTKKLEAETGRGFCKLSKQFKCVVKIDGEVTGRAMDAQQSCTTLNLWCNTHEDLKDIVNYLTTKATNIQFQHIKERNKRLALRAARNQNRVYRHHSSEGRIYMKETFCKETLTDDFERKQWKKKSHSNNTNGQKTKEECSPLKGGHCRNCLKPFATLKGSDACCAYHPGFIHTVHEGFDLGSAWSCCGSTTECTSPSENDHSENGCCTGTHDWRPHTKASRERKKEKSYIQHICKRK